MKEVEKIINEIKGADKDALKKAQIRPYIADCTVSAFF